MSSAAMGSWPSIPAMVAATEQRFGGQQAIVDGEVCLSYSELAAAGREFGAALVASGIEPGDRVAIWCFNCAEWVIAAIGVWEAAAALVPVNTRFKGAEAADILTRSRSRVLVTVTDFLATDYIALLAESGIELPDLEAIVVARGAVRARGMAWTDFVARATDETRAEVRRRCTAIGPEGVSDILFTSGTTGSPKGVVQTHGRTLHVATDWAAMTGLSPADRYLMVNPYFHMFGLKAGILAAIAGGATMLPEAVFDVDRVLARASAERVTVLPGPPTLYQSILEHPTRDSFNLAALRVAVTGAADIPVALIRRVLDELPFAMVIAGYGLTEGGTATATSPDDDAETIATTVGRPRPGFEVRVVGTTGDDMPVGSPGEILLRSPSIMKDYLDDPEATAEVLGQDGWLRTGDIGVLDERGCLRIVGRSKDMFIVGGFNAYPAEIENLLLRHPDVAAVAVVGVPDDRLGEVGMAFVVRRSGSATTGAELISWARDEMANYKVPRFVELVDELPTNAAGKVLKTELRQRATHRLRE